jgi:copper chaperone CopZ
MKKIVFMMVMLFVALLSYAQVQTVQIKTSAQCEMCKSKIEKKVMAVKGVKNATLNMQTKTLTVKYDSQKTELNVIKTAVSKAGYDADEVKADEKAYAKLKSCCKKKPE